VIGYLRERQITFTYDPASGTLNAGTAEGRQHMPHAEQDRVHRRRHRRAVPLREQPEEGATENEIQ